MFVESPRRDRGVRDRRVPSVVDSGMRSASSLVGWLVVLAAVVLYVRFVPAWWCGRDASGMGSEANAALARRVARDLERPRSFHTGSARFDGEWTFGTAQMAALGLGQVALAAPEGRAWAVLQMDRAIEAARSEPARAFDAEAWSEDPLASLDGDKDHAAYLGYLNLALSLRRRLGPSPTAGLSDAVTEALRRRLRRRTWLETYPGEIYPVDNLAALASIALYDAALQREPAEARRWLARWAEASLDPATGLVVQAVDATGRPVDAARGSGSALSAYFASFADLELARRIDRAVGEQLYREVLGFGVVREYPAGVSGRGDIDSGPLVFGFSISASGFGFAGARLFGDSRRFAGLYRTYHLFGAPRATHGELSFVSGGALGNAILLAMLTRADAPVLP